MSALARTDGAARAMQTCLHIAESRQRKTKSKGRMKSNLFNLLDLNRFVRFLSQSGTMPFYDQRLVTMRPKAGHNETKGRSQQDQRPVTMRPKRGRVSVHDETKKRSCFWSRRDQNSLTIPVSSKSMTSSRQVFRNHSVSTIMHSDTFVNISERRALFFLRYL